MDVRKLSTVALAVSAALFVACDSSSPPASAPAPAAEPAAEAPAAEPVAKAPAPAAEPAAPAAMPVADTTSRGFVVSQWYDALPEVDPADCPEGFNLPESEHYKVDMEAFNKARKEIGYREAQEKFFPPDACANPTAQEDPGFKTFNGPVVLPGLDLDGVDSKKDDGTKCAHDDFTGPNGETGVDSQHWRLLGCTKAYQPGGQIDRLYRGGNMVKEGYPILIELLEVDDPQNDDSIQVRISSSQDPIEVGASGEVLRDLSLRHHEEAKYVGATAPGKIVDGVITSEPVDLKLRLKQQVIDAEFFYRDARIRAEMQPDGKIAGVLGFYWDADNFYTVNNDHHIGEYHSGRIAAETRGYMCAGIYNAIPKMTDGHPDPETGECTSISTQMHFEGTPAFVLPQETESATSPADASEDAA